MTTSNALLTSLAILKANWDESQGTYIDNFLPFFLDAVQHSNSDSVDMQVARKIIHERFGIQLPLGVLSTLSKRSVQNGFGRRENGAFLPDPVKLAKVPPLASQKAEYLRRQTALVNDLIKFALEKYGMIFTQNDAEDALLAHVEEYSNILLPSVVRGESYLGSGRKSGSQDIEFLVNAFISHVVSSVPESFAHLEAVVKGSMLAVSLYLPNAGEIGRRFDNTTLYLDTPLVVRALGYEGTQAKEVIDDLLILCRSTGASIACFEHSIDEVKGILNRASRSLGRVTGDRNQRRKTDIHFSNIGATSSDLMLMTQSLEDDVAGLQIQILEKTSATAHLTIDELKLEEQMEEEITYNSRDALLNDLDSLTAIHRIRNGRSTSRLETCKAILVTSNGSLARVGQSFFVRGGDHQWPVAMTDHHLATLLWLKKPQAAPDLPRRQILADCYAALEPGSRLWGCYLDEIDRLGREGKASEADLMILRYSTEAERGLMDRTLGNPTHVNSETIAGILQTAKEQITQSAVLERDAAFDSEAEALERLSEKELILQEKDLKIKRTKKRKRGLREESRRLAERIEELEKAENNRKLLAKQRAENLATNIYYTILITFGVFFALSAIALFPEIYIVLPSWVHTAGLICLPVATVGGLATLFLGGSIKWSAKFVRTAVSQRLERKYMKQLGE